MNIRNSRIIAGLGFGAVLVAASTLGVVRSGSDDDDRSAVLPAQAAAFVVGGGGQPLDATIAQLTERVERVPRDHVAWASLGMAYVQQARVTADTDLHGRAEVALDRSLAIDERGNYLAHAARSSLASGQHDFVAARDHAEQGLEINAYNSMLWGALSDAQIQLGEYEQAAESVQRMLDLSPDASALARASYLRELNGDVAGATELMERSLSAAATAADRSFAHLQLGNLAFHQGDPLTALDRYDAALADLPDSSAAAVGRGHALAGLGRTDEALAVFEELVSLGIEPFYRLHYAELLESVGRTDEAAAQYERFDREETAMAASEPLPHAAFVLFLADHGQEGLALELAQRAVGTAPFLDTHDAHAWALYRLGRHEEAWAAIQPAFELETPIALFHYHAGMIRLALDDEAGARQHLERALAINPHFNPVAATTAERTLEALETGT